MTELYPDPPHLLVGLYDDSSETETFAAVCRVAGELGCEPAGHVAVVPTELDFDWISDLGAARDVRAVTTAGHTALCDGADPELRAIQARFSHRQLGTVVVEYLPKEAPDRHPVGIAMSAAVLGLPETIWTGSDRKAAGLLVDRAKTFLEAAVTECGALYGGIGVELRFPTPRQLAKEPLPTELFVSQRLLDSDKSLADRVATTFTDDNVTRWKTGSFYASWAPFASSVGQRASR
ncbi:hypothetical protein AB5J62_22690 [Amycolatopsis sp. cg5]|uniref:hypothetical protein n=1 Tax=Amycolatopsis sp. cg5 TaxID=3238802 RepID=UPI003524840E